MNFNTINELYEYLEKQTFIYKSHSSIGDIWHKFRDAKYESREMDSANIAQIEMDIFNFVIRDNKLHFMWSGSAS